MNRFRDGGEAEIAHFDGRSAVLTESSHAAAEGEDRTILARDVCNPEESSENVLRPETFGLLSTHHKSEKQRFREERRPPLPPPQGGSTDHTDRHIYECCSRRSCGSTGRGPRTEHVS